MTIQDKQKKIIDEFAGISDWDERYKKIIELGKKLEPMPESQKTEENKVKGCQSQVWLVANLTPQGTIQFKADSDALIVKGLVALVLSVYNDSTPDEVLSSPPEFIEKIGLKSNLSPSRANGLIAMIKQVTYYATAFKYIVSSR